MDIYYEQYVIDDRKERNKGKKVLFTAFYYINIIFVAAALLWLFLMFMTPSDSLINLITSGIFLVLTAVSLFFVRRQKNSLDVDFDYILSDTRLRIVRVFNRRRRKLYLDVDVKKLAAYGPVTAEDSFNRYDHTPGVKKQYAVLSEDEKKIYFMYYTDGPDKTLVLFEPDETLLRNMRLAIGRDIVAKR
ncbi:MAG: hypothetical protein LBL66_08235 [Clostridiales bacterium]|jgi:hypothetical protein|nr:hypothetical protein [Clostridiales bacterium]